MSAHLKEILSFHVTVNLKYQNPITNSLISAPLPNRCDDDTTCDVTSVCRPDNEGIRDCFGKLAS